MASALHEAARAYAAAGIPIFPIVVRGTRPACEHGFQDATVSVAQIDAWWTENPEYNIGLCPEHAGWVVVDIDTKKGKGGYETAAKLGLPSTPDECRNAGYAVRTPSNGCHIYYCGSGPSTVEKLGPGLDTRGIGGYVLVPPSRTDVGSYEVISDGDIPDAPSWLLTGITTHDTPSRATVQELDLAVNVVRGRNLLHDRVQRGSVAIEGQGGDRATYQIACELLELGLSSATAWELLAVYWNPHCVPPWDEQELLIKVENASNYAQNDPGAFGAGDPTQVFGQATQQLPAQPIKRSAFHMEDEEEQEQGTDPRWLIPQLLPAASTVMWLGATQSFKSFLALDIALAIASGVETFGKVPLEQGLVFYTALEGRLNIKKQRRNAWKLARSVTQRLDKFFVGRAPMVALDAEVQEFGNEITKRSEGNKISLIILDTIAKSMAGLNENDAKDAGRFIQFCDSLVETFGCTVLAIHHSGKDESRGGRGSSAFHAGFDSVVEIKRHEGTRAAEVWVRKHKDAAEPDKPWTFEGKEIAGSLVFQLTTPGEHRRLTAGDDEFAPRLIGRALMSLQAIGQGRAVTTLILAQELTPGQENEAPEARASRASAVAKRLGALSRHRLEAYCEHSSQGLRWFLPDQAGSGSG